MKTRDNILNIFSFIKNKKGLSIVEILVAASIFFVLFTAVAATYAVGINLQYRSELSTSAELIGQFMLEYFTSNHPLSIVRTTDYSYLGNLPYPEGAYEYLNETYPNQVKTRNELEDDDFEAIYDNAASKGSRVHERYYRSEWAPHPLYFPYIFMIDGFTKLPPGFSVEDEEGKINLNTIFPETVKFNKFEYIDSQGNNKYYYQIFINSFPPFLIAHSPDLRYRLTVREGTFNPTYPVSTWPIPVEEIFYEVTIEVEWYVKGRAEANKYEIKNLVPY